MTEVRPPPEPAPPHRFDAEGRRVARDNASIESCFALLQKNVLDRERWRTREELRITIITWIERTHHRSRRQARQG